MRYSSNLNPANIVTIIRIILVPLFPFLLYFENFSRILILLLFIILCFSDFLDGFLARKLNQVTDLGKLLDPLADKILITVLLLFFLQKGQVDYVSASIIIIREYSVLGLRAIAANKKIIIKADLFGKIKTIIHMTTIAWLIMEWDQAQYFIFSSVIIAIISGINYFYQNKKVLKT